MMMFICEFCLPNDGLQSEVFMFIKEKFFSAKLHCVRSLKC